MKFMKEKDFTFYASIDFKILKNLGMIKYRS